MKIEINGAPVSVSGSPMTSLLTFLRETLGVHSVKDGCSGQGVCGCCTVLINGRAIQSCTFKLGQLQEGMKVETVEGLTPNEREAFVAGFLNRGGAQCGFCTPGIVMAGAALLRQNPNPDAGEVKKAIRGNLCRCTGYKKIIESITEAGELLQSDPSKTKTPRGGVGQHLHKYNGALNILGERPFTGDLVEPDMLSGALKFSDYPRARLVHLDVSKALELEGVVKVLTAADIPGDPRHGLVKKDWPLMIGIGSITHYVGDIVAMVLAETPSQARRAVALIQAEYEVLEPITDPEKALMEGSNQVHDLVDNCLIHSEVKRGNADSVLDNSAFVVEGIYETQCIEHAFMEPESSLAKWDSDGHLNVFSQGQGVYEDRRQIASILGTDPEKIVVELVPNGGGFGGKEDLSVQGYVALASWLTQRPVKLTLRREESMRMHPKKHPMKLHFRLGCDSAGKLTALWGKIIADTGAYASVGMKVLERAVGHACGPYFIPHVSVEGRAVYTNNVPNGAMRGFGVNQAHFALESCMEDLCHKGGFDPFEFRYQNAVQNGDLTATGQRIEGGAGVRACLEALKSDYMAARDEGKKLGLACGIKNTGVGNGGLDACTVRLEALSQGRVRVHHGWTEMGQGVFTVCQQILIEELGLSSDQIEVLVNTSFEAPSGMTTASRATVLVGNALLVAVQAMKDSNQEMGPGTFFDGHWSSGVSHAPGADVKEPRTHFSYSYAAQCVILDENGKIEKVLAAHDAGKIINPILFEGQIEGSVHMGLGYAIKEEFIQEGGIPKTTKFGKCGVLRATEMPDVKVIGVEIPDPYGPYGAKGVGEIGLVPTAAAVGNALFQWDGKRRYKLPFKENQLIRTKRQ